VQPDDDSSLQIFMKLLWQAIFSLSNRYCNTLCCLSDCRGCAAASHTFTAIYAHHVDPIGEASEAIRLEASISKQHCVNQTVHQGVPGIASASSSSSGVEVLAKYLTRHTANPSEHTVASRQFHHVHKAGLDSAGTKHCPTYIHVLLRNISQGTTTTTRPWPNILEQTRYGRLDPT